MKRTPFYKAVVCAFFSRPFYREVAERWRWRSGVHLALLLSICWLPLVVGLSREMHLEAKDFVRQLPDIAYSNGEVSVEVDQPYFIRTRNGEEAMIIDTTGEITSLDGRTAEILLTSTQLVAKQRTYDTRTIDFSRLPPGEFLLTQEMATNWYRVLGVVMVPFFWGLLVGGSLTFRVLQALFYSIFGLLMMRFFKARLSYPAILSLTMIAVTPAVVIRTLLRYMGAGFPFAWLLFFVVSMSFLAFGIRSTVRSQADIQADA